MKPILFAFVAVFLTPITAPCLAQIAACASDVSGDGVVSGADLALVLGGWGPCTTCDGDVNGDHIVDGVDLAFVLTRWGGLCTPTVISVLPLAGPIQGGSVVTVLGSHLLSPTSVTFGGTPGTVASSTRTSVSVIAPPRSAGAAAVIVTTQGGSVNASDFNYFGAPTVTEVSPNTGTTVGGESVSINGSGFYGSPTVRFGKAAATSVTVVSPSQLIVVTPAGTHGSSVAVSVTTVSGGGSQAGAYVYSVVTPPWATLVEAVPDPSVVTSESLRSEILATGYAWRVRDVSSQIEMLLVPPGVFEMGCIIGSDQYSCNPEQLPTHTVTLTTAFYAGRYEVKQSEWMAKMGYNPSFFQDLPDSPLRPLQNIGLPSIANFLALTGLRLLTEAEWEFTCRAGTATPLYNGTADDSSVGDLAWYLGNSWDPANPGLQAHAVGGKQPNDLGFYDMLGNVWEWVQDWYSSYPSEAQVDPTGPNSGVSQARVARGGSYSDSALTVRSTVRVWFLAGLPDYHVGFRVARNP